MVTRKMMQGDSYPILFTITMNGSINITPDMVAELEICVGGEDEVAVRKTFSSESVWYDSVENKWIFWPSQQETLDMDPGDYDVTARLRFGEGSNAYVIGVKIGKISISDTQSEEVI